MASMNGLSKLGLPKLSDNMDPEDARALRSYCLLYTSDFEGVEKVRARVRQNGTLAQQLLQLQGQMARLTAALAQQPGGTQRCV